MSVTQSPTKHQPVPDGGVPIAEAARRSGVSVHTLRYYERAGLMTAAPGRTGGGTRRYRDADLAWIRVCTRLRATGMSIELVRRYADLVRAGEGNEQQRLELFESHRDRVLARLAEVTENLQLIDHKIDVYRRRLDDGDAGTLWSVPPAP